VPLAVLIATLTVIDAAEAGVMTTEAGNITPLGWERFHQSNKTTFAASRINTCGVRLATDVANKSWV
jgi:hypothetical protein